MRTRRKKKKTVKLKTRKKVTLIDVFIFTDMSHKKKVGLMWVFYSLTPHCALWFLTHLFNDGNQTSGNYYSLNTVQTLY